MALSGYGDDSQYHHKICGYSTTHVVNFIDMLKIEDQTISMQELNLPVGDCRGQAYNEAGSVL